jgi:hypothetical protein
MIDRSQSDRRRHPGFGLLFELTVDIVGPTDDVIRPTDDVVLGPTDELHSELLSEHFFLDSFSGMRILVQEKIVQQLRRVSGFVISTASSVVTDDRVGLQHQEE